MPKHGKKYAAAAAKVEAGKLYTPKDAVELIKEISFAGFDETIEATFRLGVDTRKADQNIRGSISLPHGTGKTASPSSPRASRLVPLRRPAPISLVPTTSSLPSPLATSTSTLPSPPRR